MSNNDIAISPFFTTSLQNYLLNLYSGRNLHSCENGSTEFKSYLDELVNGTLTDAVCSLRKSFVEILKSGIPATGLTNPSLLDPVGDIHVGPVCTSLVSLSARSFFLKCRSPKLDFFWNQLNDLLGFRFHSPTPIYSSYSSSSFLQSFCFPSEYNFCDIDSFLETLGELYGILSLFGFTDAHKDNFIVSQHGINLVDPETLFSSYAYNYYSPKLRYKRDPFLFSFSDYTEFLYQQNSQSVLFVLTPPFDSSKFFINY
jgi:Domain of unknown function (DUF4135)